MAKKNRWFTMAVTQEELFVIHHEARAAGISATAYVKRTIFGPTVPGRPPLPERPNDTQARKDSEDSDG